MPEYLRIFLLKIPYQGRLVLRGEAIITYSDFETDQ